MSWIFASGGQSIGASSLVLGCSHNSISSKCIAIFTMCKREKKKKKDKLEAHKAHHAVPHSYKIEENLNMQTFAHTFSYVYIFFSYVYFYSHTKIPEGTLKSGGFVRVTGFLRNLIFH